METNSYLEKRGGGSDKEIKSKPGRYCVEEESAGLGMEGEMKRELLSDRRDLQFPGTVIY